MVVGKKKKYLHGKEEYFIFIPFLGLFYFFLSCFIFLPLFLAFINFLLHVIHSSSISCKGRRAEQRSL